ncbi:MAG: GNAT family N-acetyltransferase [Candidatus Bathyarchaeota archaeon]|nr:GNAT family N-acetyltransferase [Candidatus Bathyarchaeota archaeon]
MYEKDVTLNKQTTIHLRPGETRDFEMLWTMLSTLSEDSLQFLHNRFIRDEIETGMTHIDYDNLLPIVAVVKDQATGKTRIAAFATLGFQRGESRKHRAEFDIIVHDSYQGKGLGTVLTQHMLDIAREKGLKKVYLKTNTGNQRAIHVYEKLGFKIEGKLIMEHYHYLTQQYGDDYRMAIIL